MTALEKSLRKISMKRLRLPQWPMRRVFPVKVRSALLDMPVLKTRAGLIQRSGTICAQETGVDAMAVSVGNVHLQQNKEGGLDEELIAHRCVATMPLVIHGGSGVPIASASTLHGTHRDLQIQHRHLGARMAFWPSVARCCRITDPTRFDRVQILKETHLPVKTAAQRVIRALYKPKSNRRRYRYSSLRAFSLLTRKSDALKIPLQIVAHLKVAL